MTTEDRIPCIPCSPTLEILVPSLKLCQQIPKGAFEDSALVWWGACVYPRIYPDGVRYGHPWHKRGITPAPTLAEIMADLKEFQPAIVAFWLTRVEVQCWGDQIEEAKNAKSTTAALKLWLKMKGKE